LDGVHCADVLHGEHWAEHRPGHLAAAPGDSSERADHAYVVCIDPGVGGAGPARRVSVIALDLRQGAAALAPSVRQYSPLLIDEERSPPAAGQQQHAQADRSCRCRSAGRSRNSW
jgi:hypothetical protein